MIIAVTYEDGQVFQHFGHTKQFKIYDVDKTEIKSSRIVEVEGHGHDAMASFLGEQGVDAVLCGGVGGGARYALSSRGIVLYPGITGNADECIKALLSGGLEYDPTATCDEDEGCSGDCAGDCGDCGDCSSCDGCC